MTVALESLRGPGPGLTDLFEEHHERVLAAAYRVTGNAQDAEDVLQTVFLRLVRTPGGPRGIVDALQPNPGAYLHRAAVNAALDLLRGRRRAPIVPIEPVEPTLTGAPGGEPDAVQRGRELQAWLRGAIARLSPQSAEVFVLHVVEGLANHEIATLLGLTRNAVGVLIHRARRQLRADLAAFEKGDRP